MYSFNDKIPYVAQETRIVTQILNIEMWVSTCW